MASKNAESENIDTPATGRGEGKGLGHQHEVKSSQVNEKEATVSQRIQHLRHQKKSSKNRLTKARNYLHNLVTSDVKQSKNTIRRQIKKIQSEFDIVEKIIIGLKECYAIDVSLEDEQDDVDGIIESLDEELISIEHEVDFVIKVAENHVIERLNDGENDSDTLSIKSGNSIKSSVDSLYTRLPIELERTRRAAQAANERLMKMQQEQVQKEHDLQRQMAELELMKQRTDEARKIADLSEAKLSDAENKSVHSDLSSDYQNSYPGLPPQKPKIAPVAQSTPFSPKPSHSTVASVRLKGVELPTFSGDDKTDYETWKAAFMSIVDRADIPVSEKMLRLQNCLSGKALKLVKDLGFSENAYDKAKSKLEKKYGGERRLQIKHMTSLRGWRKIRPGNFEDLEDFLVVLERVSLALNDSSASGKELTGHNLNLTAKEKLPEEDILSYKHWLIEHSLDDDLKALIQWIELRVQVMEETKEETAGITKRKYDKSEERKPDKRDDRPPRARSYNTTKTRKCIVHSCEGNHPPWACPVFKSLSVADRKTLVVKSKRCFRCLAAGHFSNKCPNARKCGVDGCTSNQHSSYLHESRDKDRQPTEWSPSTSYTQSDTFSQPQSANRPSCAYLLPSLYPPEPSQQAPTFQGYPSNQTSSSTRTHTTQQADTVSLMILPAVISNGSGRLRVNVMLDPCSTGSYVTEAAAEELKLQGEYKDLTISGTGGAELKKTARQVNFTVGSVNNDFCANLHASVLDTITSDTPAFEWSKLKDKWPHLKSIPFQNVARRRQIDVLIGSDHPMFHRVLKETHGNSDSDPIARLTNLGWVCFGPTLVEEYRRKCKSHFTRTYHCNQTTSSDDTLLRQFWELEAIGIKDTAANEMSPDEKAALTSVKNTLQFNNDRYSIGVPWKDGEPNLANNYDVALTRLKSQEKSLIRKGPEAMQAYSNIIEDYEKKGYITRVETTEDKDQWYLPHFAVVKEERETTKVRIVFDAAAKSGGKSLNDTIRPGPKLQRDLTNVLIRFRRSPVAISGDISEMFLQVCLSENDRRFHRFLWRDFDVSKEPQVYEFQRLVFGNTASPFCSQFVIQNHAQTHASEYPEAAETVANSMYVDDVLDSCEDADEAKKLRKQLSELLSSAGFHLRKWSSNNASVVEDIPENERLPSLCIQDGQLTCKVKTLGVLWKAETDVFTFNVKTPDVTKTPTKRDVLSAISTLFDPLQFLSPFTVRAKILLQEIWTAGLQWDDPLPDNLAAKWKGWVDELPVLSTFEIPRCLRLPKAAEMQLHMFCDASKDAYASAAYLMCLYDDLMPTTCLIASKSRVAPLKAMTIPRLELMGAIISTRLSNSIAKSLCVDKVVFWTDSTNVLCWIRNQSRNFKPFVANRVSEIHTSTRPEQWRHVPGELNPADLPTRGVKAADLQDNKFWKEGPEFLKKDESHWPVRLPNEPQCQQKDAERPKTARMHATRESTKILDPNNFSNYRRLIRVTGWILRFITNCRLSESRLQSSVLSAEETDKAEILLLKRAQAEGFPNGKNDKALERINPLTDDRGLLRVNGRLCNSEMSYAARHPIILAKNDSLTNLIVRTVHEELGHGSGVEHALTTLRAKFWIIKGRRVVRDFIHRCPACRLRFTAKPAGQMMAPLPRTRVTSSLRAFERVGVDYGGPYLTKHGRGRAKAKRYLCLFTCLTTRAVHLEMSYSLDTDSFINAFTRMTSRRGTPSYVVSDNGTNFVAAERELRELVENLDQNKIVLSTSRQQQNIEWDFNPPAGPHFGGVFESMIKSAKKAIKAILSDADITDEELHTAMCGAEQLLNSRPITYVSSDANDLCPLTPDHFIVGRMGGAFAAEAADKDEVFNPRKRWHRVQQLIGQVWKRWRREFLPSLNLRKKWFHPQRNLSKDDVVMIVESNASRGDWPLGRVLEVFPGSDGLVRVAKVRARGKEYLRPIHRLCPLEYA